MSSPLVRPEAIEKTVVHNGTTYTIWHYPITRATIKKALQRARAAWKTETGEEEGVDNAVFEDEIIKRVVKRWSLGTHPSLEWELIGVEDWELADKISEAIGLDAALDWLSRRKDAKEIEKAKNSEGAAETPSTPI